MYCTVLASGGGRDGDEGWNYDPSEPRYCICNQVSYGDMVACDNVDVSCITNWVELNGIMIY